MGYGMQSRTKVGIVKRESEVAAVEEICHGLMMDVYAWA
jgi:hypothetical protein